MLHKIVAAATTWMNDRPFDTYMFLYHFPRGPAGGGHGTRLLNCHRCQCRCTCSHSPEVLSSVTAHEFFHLWNVKRIRPQTLEPVDYTKENYTRALWFSEGCTSTAADIIQLRAWTSRRTSFRTTTGSRNSRTRAPPRTPHAVSGRLKPGCMARRQPLLPPPRAQRFLLQQRRTARNYFRLGSSRSQPRTSLSTRSFSMDE